MENNDAMYIIRQLTSQVRNLSDQKRYLCKQPSGFLN